MFRLIKVTPFLMVQLSRELLPAAALLYRSRITDIHFTSHFPGKETAETNYTVSCSILSSFEHSVFFQTTVRKTAPANLTNNDNVRGHMVYIHTWFANWPFVLLDYSRDCRLRRCLSINVAGKIDCIRLRFDGHIFLRLAGRMCSDFLYLSSNV